MSYLNILKHKKTIRKLSDFINLIRGDNPFFQNKFVIFRGQPKDWSLRPTVFRHEKPNETGTSSNKRPLDIENDIYREFREKIYAYNIKLNLDNPWELVCFAQHFGVPTRLVDWSRDPLSALYFALENPVEEPAVVWCLNVTRLSPNQAHKESTGHITNIERRKMRGYQQGFLISDLKSDMSFFSGLPSKSSSTAIDFDNELLVIQPPDIDSRMRSQGSLFTVHLTNDEKTPVIVDHGLYLNNQFPKEDGQVLLKLTIPVESKVGLMDNLRNLNITPYTVYPDLKGLGVYFMNVLRDQSRESPFVPLPNKKDILNSLNRFSESDLVDVRTQINKMLKKKRKS